ncbi:succinate dehydrogenase cytochrome b560 subunit [Rhizodiscina lignyota]|uniref:Succinate dehydrogenase cytochrome b560 subunit n=1 Tax=Rhizodiscina lignyota TaxID=1504668 RepID=A0A9P4ICY6_9PEZI|nr:succinate dehydrogenase cytochrome b560 subunit [Rhizodiscina lignyota]
MLAQRSLQQSVRRLAAQQPGRIGITRFAAPAAIATGHAMPQWRQVTTQNVSQDTDILAKQRLHRPVAPHLGIYRPQITWIPSMFNRITGLMLSGPLYLFSMAYLVAPLMGWHLESQSIAAAFGALPVIAKVGVKGLIAWPFTFHSLNGVRHLMWDFALGFKNKTVAQTGWTVVGLSAVTAIALALM